jgi:hypothetical protein
VNFPGLVDGLGHGPAATHAAQAAIAALAARPEVGPVGGLHLCHEALVGTRGAVVAIAHVDPVAGRLTFAGIGNAEIRLRQGEHEERPISYRGVVGGTMRTVRPFVLDLGPEWLLLMHTDGVTSRLELPSVLRLDAIGLRGVAEDILRDSGRERDDAAVGAEDVEATAAARPARTRKMHFGTDIRSNPLVPSMRPGRFRVPTARGRSGTAASPPRSTPR